MCEIEPKPSRRLGVLLLGMLALALLALALAALPDASRVALGLAACGLTGWRWRRAHFTEPLRVAADGRLQCRDEQGEWRDAEVLGDSFVSSALLVLRYRTAGGRVRSQTLLADSADADGLRRLRVSLRWASRTRSDTSSPGAG